jgi:two-component system NtrC family sensor kinase
LSIDAQRNIIDCNRFFRQTFNVTKEGVTGKSILMFFKTEDHSVLENFFNSLIISEASCVQQRIFSMVSPEKNDTLMANLKAVYIDNNETGISLVIAMEDVTKQLQLEEEQKIARKQLYRSARLASIGTLSSGVAHELNNPLTAILGFSSAILDRFKHDEKTPSGEMEQFLGIINQEAIRCKGIIETLSKFANDGIMQVKDILLCDCINDALALTKSKAARSNIMIKNSLSQTIFVKADVNKLEQVFVNVLSNCLDFFPENCTVDITAVLSRDPVRYFALSISDNGPGISFDDLPNVFDPFFTTKEVGQGTGMGLAICHKLMEECDGRIDILSEKGKGTTVIIEMPLGSNEFEFMESR